MQSDPEERQLPFLPQETCRWSDSCGVSYTCISLQVQHKGHGQNSAMLTDEATSVTSGVDTEID